MLDRQRLTTRLIEIAKELLTPLTMQERTELENEAWRTELALMKL